MPTSLAFWGELAWCPTQSVTHPHRLKFHFQRLRKVHLSWLEARNTLWSSDLSWTNSEKTELKHTLLIISDGYRWMSAQGNRCSHRLSISLTSIMQGLKTTFEARNNESYRGNWKMRHGAISAQTLYLITDILNRINQSALQGSTFSIMRQTAG